MGIFPKTEQIYSFMRVAIDFSKISHKKLYYNFTVIATKYIFFRYHIRTNTVTLEIVKICVVQRKQWMQMNFELLLY